MKVDDFKLLATMPSNYEYELFHQPNGAILAVGKEHQTIIGFTLHQDKLTPVSFEQVDKLIEADKQIANSCPVCRHEMFEPTYCDYCANWTK